MINATDALTAPQVLAKAQALGVVLALIDGELKATGKRAGVEELAPHIRACKPDLVKLLARPPTPAPDPVKTGQPLPRFHVAQPWNVADRAYQGHHWNCTTCKAAARSLGHSARCTEGQALYDSYEQAFEAAMNEGD